MADYTVWILAPVALFILYYLFTNSIRKNTKRISRKLHIPRHVVSATLYSLNKSHQRFFIECHDYKVLAELLFAREIMIRLANPDIGSIYTLGFYYGLLDKSGYPPCDSEGKDYKFPAYAYARPTEKPIDIQFFKDFVENIFETDDFKNGRNSVSKRSLEGTE